MDPEILEEIRKVHGLFKDSALTLSAAESCTGGLISHYITTLPGASRFFSAAVVSYSEKAKKEIIGVSPDTIHKHGVVSRETAVEMAERVRLLTKTDYSLSATGNLGPEALEGKEKGLIYIAASREGKTISKELRLKGSRDENKKDAAVAALRLLLELAKQEA